MNSNNKRKRSLNASIKTNTSTHRSEQEENIPIEQPPNKKSKPEPHHQNMCKQIKKKNRNSFKRQDYPEQTIFDKLEKVCVPFNFKVSDEYDICKEKGLIGEVYYLIWMLAYNIGGVIKQCKENDGYIDLHGRFGFSFVVEIKFWNSMFKYKHLAKFKNFVNAVNAEPEGTVGFFVNYNGFDNSIEKIALGERNIYLVSGPGMNLITKIKEVREQKNQIDREEFNTYDPNIVFSLNSPRQIIDSDKIKEKLNIKCLYPIRQEARFDYFSDMNDLNDYLKRFIGNNIMEFHGNYFGIFFFAVNILHKSVTELKTFIPNLLKIKRMFFHDQYHMFVFAKKNHTIDSNDNIHFVENESHFCQELKRLKDCGRVYKCSSNENN
ncbi:21015_t:CDS:1, partial [Gigaspora rosea]